MNIRESSSLESLNAIARRRVYGSYLPFDRLAPGRYHIKELFPRLDTRYNSGKFSFFFYFVRCREF